MFSFFIFQAFKKFRNRKEKMNVSVWTLSFSLFTHVAYLCCSMSPLPFVHDHHSRPLSFPRCNRPFILIPSISQETAWAPTCWLSTRCCRSPHPSAFTTGCPTRWATGQGAGPRTRRSTVRSTTACRQVRRDMMLERFKLTEAVAVAFGARTDPFKVTFLLEQCLVLRCSFFWAAGLSCQRLPVRTSGNS